MLNQLSMSIFIKKTGFLLAFFVVIMFTACSTKEQPKAETVKKEKAATEVKVADLSITETPEYLLKAVNDKKNLSEYISKLAAISPEQLESELNTEDKKMAFWVNAYNAFIQITLTENPDLYKDRDEFFKKKQVTIAGTEMSFDDIEHGIIRSTTIKLSKGYVSNPFAEGFEKRFQLKERDPRIHFILNCGAKDCPPVYIYNAKTLDKDFDQVAAAYLKKVSSYDEATKKVKTTPLFQWFTGDWGGKDGVKEMLARYQIIPNDYKDIELEYIDYDWTLALGNIND